MSSWFMIDYLLLIIGCLLRMETYWLLANNNCKVLQKVTKLKTTKLLLCRVDTSLTECYFLHAQKGTQKGRPRSKLHDLGKE